MSKVVKKIINQCAAYAGIKILRRKNALRLEKQTDEIHKFLDLVLAEHANVDVTGFGQLRQDIVALIFSGFKHGGFFVEFGATDGISLSNTYLLEQNYNWDGILAEPNTRWHADLWKNRCAKIETLCVTAKSGEAVEFLSASQGELSTIADYADNDQHLGRQINATSSFISTISLNDLLAKHKAPRYVDFLSIDTEGSEYDILRGFDFASHEFGFICVEHNFTPAREKIQNLLVAHGYTRVFASLSNWDDWYLHPNVIAKNKGIFGSK